MLDDIDPRLWGQYFWGTLHFISLSYPNNPNDEDKQKIKTAILSLVDVLPCIICREHFNELLKQFPLNDYILQNKKNLVLWLFTLHNIVNKQNNKKIFTVDEFYNKYVYPKSCNNYSYYFFIIIIVVIILCCMCRI